MSKDEGKLNQVLQILRKRGIRLQGASGSGGKYLFEDQSGSIYFIKNASLMNHRPLDRKGVYKVWTIKVGKVHYDYLVCGLFKDGALRYVTRAPNWAVNFRATMIMENRVKSRRGWEILYQER